MVEVCADCKKEFDSAASLDQHRQAKHVQHPVGKKKGSPMLKLLILASVLLIAAGSYLVFSVRDEGDLLVPQPDNSFDAKAFAGKIPKGPIHWHPHVTILVKGESITIPPNVGLETAAHKPVHTHEADNILHWEVDNPTVENMQLGYFFGKVWKKMFNSDCILDNCNGLNGTLKMYVNGSENTEFNHYMPSDGDEIKIVFE